jgi:hypothetical protein
VEVADDHVLGVPITSTASLPDVADYSFARRGGYLYAARGALLRVYELEQMGFVAGASPVSGSFADIAIEGDRAYLADSLNGITVFNIFEPGRDPNILGSAALPVAPSRILVEGSRLVAYMDGIGIEILRILNDFPLTLDSLSVIPGTGPHMALDGEYLWTVDGATGETVECYDITDSSAPHLLGQTSFPHPVTSMDQEDGIVAVTGDEYYAFLTFDAVGGLIQQEEYYTLPSFRWSHALSFGNHVAMSRAYATGDELLQAHEVTDPADPVLKSLSSSDPFDKAIAYKDNYLISHDDVNELGLVHTLYRRYDFGGDFAQSLPFIPAGLAVAAYRASADYEGQIGIYFNDFDPIQLGGNWTYRHFGHSEKWNVTLDYLGNYNRPKLNSLSIQWLYTSALIDGVEDIPGDQGGQVRLQWMRSGYDAPDSPEGPVTQYAVYRRVEGSSRGAADSGRDEREYPPGQWDFVTTLPATVDEVYSVVVPTLADSTAEGGVAWSVFFVRALTDVPSEYWDCPPDSGYSLDNLAPGVPADFLVNYTPHDGNELSWSESEDEDFDYFKIYRGDEPDFPVDPAEPLHMTIETAWVDAEGLPSHHYKISAVDFAGNESEATPPENVVGVPEETLPSKPMLLGNAPNPFNPATTISIVLPAGGARARLEVIAVDGRRVRTLVDGLLSEGHHDFQWNGTSGKGHPVASGVYFSRLTVEGRVQTCKMLLLE